MVVRKVIDRYGDNGVKIGSTIETFNDDGTLFRKTEIKFNTFGELVEMSQYKSDGSLVKNGNSLDDSETESVTATGQGRVKEGDPLVSLGQMHGQCRGELKGTEGSGVQPNEGCFDPDAHGNWTRGITDSILRTYASGGKSRQTTWAYREFTYY